MRARPFIVATVALAGVVAAGVVAIWTTPGTSPEPSDSILEGMVDAREPDCRFFKVAADALNLFEQPRPVSGFVVQLTKNDVLCVTGTQRVGDVAWVTIRYRLEKPNRRTRIEGWGVKRALQPATGADVAAL